ncbi:MAG: peptidoglycan DD-metalloendopeptidase family protein [Alphaproteobacteria bacterium]
MSAIAFRELCGIVFRERELLLRTDGRVHYLRLSSQLQVMLFLAVSGLLGWTAAVTGATLLQHGFLQRKDAEIREARVAYEGLLDEITTYQRRAAEVTTSLRDSQAWLLYRSDPSARAASVQPSAGLAALSAPEDGQLAQLDQQLLLMAETTDLLDGALQKVKLELRLAEGEREQLLSSRTSLRDRVAVLEDELGAARIAMRDAERRSAELSRRLETAEAGRASMRTEQASLIRHAGQLEVDLKAARGRGQSLEGNVRRAVERIRGVVGDGDGEAASDDLGGAVDGLLEQFNAMQSSQEAVLDRLMERTASNVAEVERTIAMTGLSLERLLGSDPALAEGQGGPFVDMSGNELAGGMSSAVDQIERQLRRWDVYKAVLAVLPLSSPIDHYHITSGYGSREDPFTGKRAWHKALDLSGWNGSPVYATAPGKVEFAGWKGRYGQIVEIDHGFGIRTRYAHLKTVLVKEGDIVGFRHKLGLLGSTGRSTGPHVHYEVLHDGQPINPLKFIQAGRYVFKE